MCIRDRRISLQRLVEILVANGQGTVLAVKGHVLVHLLYFLRLGRDVYKRQIVPGWEEQITLLKSEGVTFKDSYHVDLKKHQWNL